MFRGEILGAAVCGPFFVRTKRGEGISRRLGASALHGGVVLLVVDARALAVVGTDDATLFAGTDVAVRARAGFALVDMRLAALEAGRLVVRQGTALDAVVDALLLVDVALRVGLDRKSHV